MEGRGELAAHPSKRRRVEGAEGEAEDGAASGYVDSAVIEYDEGPQPAAAAAAAPPSPNGEDGVESSDGENVIASELVDRIRGSGADPKDVLMRLGLDTDLVAALDYSEERLWATVHDLLLQMGVERRRPERTPVTSIDEVVDLIRGASSVLILTGAGVSTSCGIPDFRSENGIYARLKTDYPTLPDPQSMFDMKYFKRDQKPFFDFAAEIWPGNFRPAPSHHFIAQVEAHSKLLRNYTQNIDTLEQVAGISRVIQCHGSFSTASCLVCKHRVPSSEIETDVKAKRIPICCKAGTDECPMPPVKEVEGDGVGAVAGRSADDALSTTSFLGPMPPVPPAPTAVAPVGAGGMADTTAPPGSFLHTPAPSGPRAAGESTTGALPGHDGAAVVAEGTPENPSSSYESLPEWLRMMLPKPEPPLQPVMKPDIVFFGQDLPEVFYENLPRDAETCDLVIVIGSSLKVSPVARIPDMIPPEVPQILINREPLPHLKFNAELLGNCDEILEEISARLGWTISPATEARINPSSTPPAIAPQPLPAMGADTEPAAATSDADMSEPCVPSSDGGAIAPDDTSAGPVAPTEGESGHVESEPEARAGFLHGHHFLPPNRFAFPGAVLAYVPSDDEHFSDDDMDEVRGDAAPATADAFEGSTGATVSLANGSADAHAMHPAPCETATITASSPTAAAPAES